MKLTKAFYLLPVLLILSLPLYAYENREPQVRFEVSAQKEIKSNAIELNFAIEKKAPTLEASTRAMQDLIEKVQKIALDQKITSQDIHIQNTYMSSTDWIFGKDYVVTSAVKITLRNLNTWGTIAKRLTQLDNDMKFSGVNYAYPKNPEIWESLLWQAGREALERKAQYERLFKTKLTLTYLRDMRIKPYEETGMMLRRQKVFATAQSTTEDISTILPTQTYGITLDLGYDIEK